MSSAALPLTGQAPLQVGVIGLGVGEQHAHAFSMHSDCTLLALCDQNAARLTEVASRFPQARRYRSAAELIGDPDIQVVAIASNDDDHASQIVQALRAGKHVFAEKPLCLHARELEQIVAAWRGAPGLRLTTNTVLRRSPRFRWLKTAISTGRLGTVFCIEGDYVYGRLHKLLSGWRGAIPGYSVMLGGGVHIVDLVLWLGNDWPVEVMAYGSDLGTRHTSFRGNDLVAALLRFESGMIAKVGANFASVYPHFHRFAVYGTEATFENFPGAISSTGRLWRGRDGGPPADEIDAPYPGMGKADMVPAFVDAVLRRGEPDVSEPDAFACMATCVAIERSLRERSPVQVEYQLARGK